MVHDPARTDQNLIDEVASISMDGFDTLVGTQMRYAYLIMRRSFVANIAPMGLTQTQCAAMWLLNANPTISQTELAFALDIDRVTMIGVIDKLKSRDLILRKKSKQDGRRFNLSLSVKGEELFSTIKERLLENDRQFANLFSPGELMVFLENLRKIAEFECGPDAGEE